MACRPSDICPTTLETMCITWEYFSTIIFSVTLTLPIFETLPTSFLPRSINIKCSANSFGSLKRSFSFILSSSSLAPLFRVPAIGLNVTWLPSSLINISGDAPTTLHSLRLR